jgi:hypothetical protein
VVFDHQILLKDLIDKKGNTKPLWHFKHLRPALLPIDLTIELMEQVFIII